MTDSPKRIRPSLSNPWVLLATWFGSGYLRPGPGTWGTAAALPFAWLMATYSGAWSLHVLIAATVVVFAIGTVAADRFDALSGGHDASEIVVDEVAGIWLTLAFFPPTIEIYALGFLLFRVFDIVKPWPIRWVDRHVGGGLGVMVDDILAAIPAALLLFAAQRWVL